MSAGASASSGSSGRSGGHDSLQQVIAADWTNKHQAIFHDACAPLPAGLTNAASSTSCYGLGQCVCSEDGQRLFMFRFYFNNLLKSVHPRQSTNRQLLTDSSVVVCLRGTAAPDADHAAPAAPQCTVELFMHIGFVLWNPFRPTYHLLRRVELPRPEDTPDAIPLEASIY